MRCFIPSISKVSLANIIFFTLFVNNSFELGFCFIPCTLYESHLLFKNSLSPPFFAFQKVAITLNETLRDYTIILFEPHSLRHYWSRNHGAILASIKQNLFHGLWAQSYFKGFSTPKFVSSVAPFSYLFLSTWVPFGLQAGRITLVLGLP